MVVVMVMVVVMEMEMVMQMKTKLVRIKWYRVFPSPARFKSKGKELNSNVFRATVVVVSDDNDDEDDDDYYDDDSTIMIEAPIFPFPHPSSLSPNFTHCL